MLSSFAAAPGRVLGRHCGSARPASVDTSDSFAFVKFVSDASGNAAGFSLSFEASIEGTITVSVLLSCAVRQLRAFIRVSVLTTTFFQAIKLLFP